MIGSKSGFAQLATAIVVTAGAVFGVVPAAAESTSRPGTLIHLIPQPAGWRGVARGFVLDYWTTRSNGRPVRASGALVLPTGPAPRGGWPVMAFDHGTSGLGPGCGGQTAPDAGPSKYIDHLVNRKFAVVAPDYVGLGRFATGPHPYLELRTEATATIDLVRAARAAMPQLSRAWGVVGDSQGGQAALGTARLQQSYAPELNFRGAIAVDPESDVEKFLPILVGPQFPPVPKQLEGGAAFFANILIGLRAARPDLDLDSYLTRTGRTVLDSIDTACEDQISRKLSGIPLGALLARPLIDERFRAALADYLTVPTSGYHTPILLLINITDTVVPSPLHIALIAQLAAGGVDFHTVFGTGPHTTLSPHMWAALDDFVARNLR